MGREKKGEFKTRGSEEKHGAVKMKKSEFYARIKIEARLSLPTKRRIKQVCKGIRQWSIYLHPQ